MSKGLEALQFMRERDMFLPSCANTIEKELKALEIITNKKVDIWTFSYCKNLREYHYAISVKYYPQLRLSKEEYDLLKEVLK